MESWNRANVINCVLQLINRMGSASKAFMAYVAEGLGNLLDWDQAMVYQRKNGSFFNSPATTAAAAIHSYNGRALDYLDSLISKFGSSGDAVQNVCPSSQERMAELRTQRPRLVSNMC